MSWLDRFFNGIRTIEDNGVTLPLRTTLDFLNCTVTDDPTNDRIIVDPSGGSSGVSDVLGTAPIVVTGVGTKTVSISAATTSTPGSLSAADKTTIDALDSAAFSAPDNSTLEISSGTLREKDGGTTNTKLANMAQATIKGRASGAGTGAPSDLTGTQVATILGLTGGNVYDTYANRPSSPAAGTVFIPSDGYGRQTYDGSEWRPIVGGIGWKGKQPPAANTWGQVNFAGGGVTTITDMGGCVELKDTGTGQCRIADQTSPNSGNSFTMTAHFVPDITLANFAAAGVVLRDNGTGKVIIWVFQFVNNGGTLSVARFSDPNTFVSSPTGGPGAIIATSTDGFWMRIVRDVTGHTHTYQFNWSGLPNAWRTFYSESETAYLAAVTHIGIVAYPGGATGGAAIVLDSWEAA